MQKHLAKGLVALLVTCIFGLDTPHGRAQTPCLEQCPTGYQCVSCQVDTLCVQACLNKYDTDVAVCAAALATCSLTCAVFFPPSPAWVACEAACTAYAAACYYAALVGRDTCIGNCPENCIRCEVQ
jgi:hypothetical protein